MTGSLHWANVALAVFAAVRAFASESGQEEVEDALFTSGGIIGSSAFVEELTRRERVAFPRERKSSPQEVCVGGLKLFALRHLKAFRK